MLADIHQVGEQIHSVYSIVADLFIITIVIIAIIFVVRVLRDSRYTIRHVSVPASLEASGLTGPLLRGESKIV